DEVEYHGQLVEFDRLWSFPKPVQKPWPPIYLGGDTALTRRRVAESYDGWISSIVREGAGLDGIRHLQQIGRQYGRPPQSLSISIVAPPPNRKLLDRYAAAGVDRVMLGLPSANADTVLQQLDDQAKLAGL